MDIVVSKQYLVSKSQISFRTYFPSAFISCALKMGNPVMQLPAAFNIEALAPAGPGAFI